MDVLKNLTPKNNMSFYDLCQILYFLIIYNVYNGCFVNIFVEQFKTLEHNRT